MKRALGFTLLELMIVVAVIAVLAIIALPMFTEQLRKGKRTEAIQAISDIQLREEKWRSYNTSYGTLTNVFVTALVAADYNNALKYYTITIPTNTATGYSITATKKASFADPKCGNFILTTLNGVSTKSVSSGDADYCWRKK